MALAKGLVELPTSNIFCFVFYVVLLPPGGGGGGPSGGLEGGVGFGGVPDPPLQLDVLRLLPPG